jgi:DNA-binding transcriptional MocR family regulator
MMSERHIVLTADSAELRRRLDPAAWVVFEELLLASTGTGEGCVASVSIRALADRLGLAKDTVARALGRLRRAGLVTARQARTDAGVFATGCYVLTVPAAITVTDHPTTSSTSRSSTSHSSTSRSSSHRSRHADQQLVLTLTT